ncbi:FAD-dependent oxidoreductase [Paenibacillus mesophilus]|uniref:FAD-dependent oxidoreductase n=1 Tax=Paenibacillus mesophilus TaxID=2582849 RepID=UPI00110E84C8|nr:FAD-dependent oxidoreductase [Paenibacillus mesophilus]TMV50872.1 FAD-dependent oxidoreductase [Paenibacillus mesophilus]
MTDFSRLSYYVPAEPTGSPLVVETDLCIYGGTAAGVAAAVQASRMGLRVVIAEFGRHLGGIAASGLGSTDHGNKGAIGGIAKEFFRELGTYYGTSEADGAVWYFEPHAAQRIYREWLEKAEIPVYYEQHLAAVEKRSGKLSQITMENGNVFRAAMFIDASYEGDLMARAGVSYHVGRESNATHGETRNGIQFGSHHHMFNAAVDPYVVEGKPDSGLLPGIMDVAPGTQGQGDRSIQAYNFRICLTNVPENRVPIPEPPGYDPRSFALLARYIRAGVWDFRSKKPNLPNGKTDTNNFGAVSTDHIGANHEWPEGDYKTRERIFQSHVTYNMGLLYFLANDESVPLALREERRQWGLAADEFTGTANWPHQLYVREGRRMVSEVVMNEKHCRHLRIEEDSIGMASYTMDSHNCRRLVLEGLCVNEGNVEIPVPGPYRISYRSIVPKGEQCVNLLVPVCLSSSHIAYGSIRMEPVFMILGQSAATAAAIALEGGTAVQDVPYEKLRQRLIQDGQVLEISNRS